MSTLTDRKFHMSGDRSPSYASGGLRSVMSDPEESSGSAKIHRSYGKLGIKPGPKSDYSSDDYLIWEEWFSRDRGDAA